MDNGVKLVKTVHNEGEFVVSRASAYHAGFNFGFNIAEAVNFALRDWLSIGNTCGFCTCVNDSVAINMRMIYMNLGLKVEDYIKDEDPLLLSSQTTTAPLFKIEKVLDRKLSGEKPDIKIHQPVNPTPVTTPSQLAICRKNPEVTMIADSQANMKEKVY